MCYSQLHELEADKYGIFLAKASGYQASAVLITQKILADLEPRKNKPLGWFERIKCLIPDDHPPIQVRLKENEKTIGLMQLASI